MGVGVGEVKTRGSRLNVQSPNKPKLLAEKGERIFARVRYWICTTEGSSMYSPRKYIQLHEVVQ